MPTLMEINGEPEEAGILTPRNGKKPSASAEEITFLDSEESNDGKLLSNGKISVGKKAKAKSGKENASNSDKKGKSRKRSGRQIGIFESIGAAPPSISSGTVLTPSTDTGNHSNAGESSTKKKKKRRTMNPSEDAFPISVHINTDDKEPKKVMITCHGVKSEFNDEIADSPIVVNVNSKGKRAIPKDYVARFLVGFGRYIS